MAQYKADRLNHENSFFSIKKSVNAFLCVYIMVLWHVKYYYGLFNSIRFACALEMHDLSIGKRSNAKNLISCYHKIIDLISIRGKFFSSFFFLLFLLYFATQIYCVCHRNGFICWLMQCHKISHIGIVNYAIKDNIYRIRNKIAR